VLITYGYSSHRRYGESNWELKISAARLFQDSQKMTSANVFRYFFYLRPFWIIPFKSALHSVLPRLFASFPHFFDSTLSSDSRGRIRKEGGLRKKISTRYLIQSISVYRSSPSLRVVSFAVRANRNDAKREGDRGWVRTPRTDKIFTFKPLQPKNTVSKPESKIAWKNVDNPVEKLWKNGAFFCWPA